MSKPQNLLEAEQAVETAKLRYHVAKSQRAMREAREDLDFWTNKRDMLDLMYRNGLIGGAA